MKPVPATSNVIISGLTAAGKTTHAHLLAGQYGLQYISSSQILLALLGMLPVRPRDFWLTDQAIALWEAAEARCVDNELVKLEAEMDWAIFDVVSLPWLHRRRAFSIWLESDVDSRVAKAIVSHRGGGRFARHELESRILQKDNLMRQRLRDRQGIDLFRDRTPFDLVVDISSCISEPTLESSMKSIKEVQEVIHFAVGWYLTQKREFRSEFQAAFRKHLSMKIIQCPADLRVEGVA